MTTMWLKDKIELCLRRVATLPSAAPDLVETLATSLRWDVGEFWEMRDGVLVCTALYQEPRLRRATSAACGEVLPPGFGVPGRAWTTRRPVWITDVRAETSMFCRTSTAIEQGMTTACAFPIVADGQAAGVLLFMSSTRRRPELDTIETLSSVAGVIGAWVAREARAHHLPPQATA